MRITLGGTDIREYSLDSLLSNISMVFQNVYLFHDTIRANICFGREKVSKEEMIEAADQILVIDDGRVAERGKHEELVSLGGKYAEFVKIRNAAENRQI